MSYTRSNVRDISNIAVDSRCASMSGRRAHPGKTGRAHLVGGCGSRRATKHAVILYCRTTHNTAYADPFSQRRRTRLSLYAPRAHRGRICGAQPYQDFVGSEPVRAGPKFSKQLLHIFRNTDILPSWRHDEPLKADFLPLHQTI